MKNFSHFSIVFYGLLFFVFGEDVGNKESYKLKLYENEDFKGGRITLEGKLDECITLGKQWENEVSSIDPWETCVVIFSGKSCSGHSLLVDIAIPRLQNHEFNDHISSLRLQKCPDLEEFWTMA